MRLSSGSVSAPVAQSSTKRSTRSGLISSRPAAVRRPSDRARDHFAETRRRHRLQIVENRSLQTRQLREQSEAARSGQTGS